MRRHAVPTLAELKERVQIVRLTTKDLCAQARRNSEAVGRVKQCMTSAEVKRDAPLREPINANAMTNAPPGTIAFPGIYVVTHSLPEHTPPHQATITSTMALPTCNMCVGVRFSRMYDLPVPLQQFDYFRGPADSQAAYLQKRARSSIGVARYARTPAWSEAARLAKDFIQTDLSLLETLANMALARYERGNRCDGDRTAARVEHGIASLRHLIGATDLLSDDLKKSFTQHCDELQRRLGKTTVPMRPAGRL